MFFLDKKIDKLKENKFKNHKIACIAIDTLSTIADCFLILIVIYLLFSIRTVPTESMVPTVMVGDRVFFQKVSVYLKDIHRGDTIMFDATNIASKDDLEKAKANPLENFSMRKEVDYLKRVIAVGGDSLFIKDGKVYINGKAIKQNYKTTSGDTYTMNKAIKVPKGYVFVMGDNRPNSRDSRFWLDSEHPLLTKNKVDGYKCIDNITFLSLNKIRAKGIFVFNIKNFYIHSLGSQE